MNNKKSPKQFGPFLAIAYYSLRAMLRNKATVFFGFAFPLIFILGFGLVNDQSTSVSIGVPGSSTMGPVYEALSAIDAVSIEKGSEESLREKLSQGRLTGILRSGDGQNYELYLSEAKPQEQAVLSNLVSGVVDKLNLKLSGVDDPPLSLNFEKVSGREFKFIDFFLPGMIGFALLTTSITSTSFGLIFLKKTLVLKRIFATPTKGLTILLGQGASRLVLVLAQTLVIVLVGVFLLDFNLIHGFFTLAQILTLSIIGLISFLGFGLLIAGLVSDENAAAPLSNLIVLPQFLVAGTFFPIESLPSWLQPLVNILPLAFFNTAIRKITVEGLALDAIVFQLIGLAVWAVVAYLAAVKTFKWE